MLNGFDYEAQWLSDLERLKDDRAFQEYVAGAGMPSEKYFELGEKLSSVLLGLFVDYGKDWCLAASIHEGNDVYARVADFAKIGKDDLVIDLGCGCGNYLVELAKRGYRRLIGVDISPYALETTTQRLREFVPETECRPESMLSFDPNRGFFIKGIPIMEELDFSKPQILCDDIRTMENLMRALYMQGIKADHATFMLHGGYNASRIEFFTYFFKEFFAEEEKPSFMIRKVESAVRKIVKAEGSFTSAIRMGFVNDETGASEPPAGREDFVQLKERACKDYGNLHDGTLVPAEVSAFEIHQEEGLMGLNWGFMDDDPDNETEFTEDYQCCLTRFQVARVLKGGA